MAHSHSLSGKGSHSTFLKIPVKVWGWLFLIAAYSFLAYKLITFRQYPELLVQWEQMPLSRFWWLGGVFILMPLNWLLESFKWKLLASSVQKISFASAIKGVLAGISTGFFTPNRVGDMVGRVMYLDAENRKPGITLSLLSGLLQNIMMITCGIPACILFYMTTVGKIDTGVVQYILLMIGFSLIFVLLYFLMPTLSLRFKKSRFSVKIKEFTDCLSYFQTQKLAKILLVSLSRYILFCIQFFVMLRFFGIELSGWQALISIPTNYLFVTFTPSFAFSEVAVRSSFAVLTIGAFSGQTVNIALAGMCIWIVNFVIPMLVGSAFLVKNKA